MLKTFKGNSEKEAYISHKKIGGQGGIRTPEDRSRLIYSQV